MDQKKIVLLEAEGRTGIMIPYGASRFNFRKPEEERPTFREFGKLIFIQKEKGGPFVFDSLPVRFYEVVFPEGMVAFAPGERNDEVKRIAELAMEKLVSGNPSFAVDVKWLMGFPANFYRAEKWPEIINLLKERAS